MPCVWVLASCRPSMFLLSVEETRIFGFVTDSTLLMRYLMPRSYLGQETFLVICLPRRESDVQRHFLKGWLVPEFIIIFMTFRTSKTGLALSWNSLTSVQQQHVGFFFVSFLWLLVFLVSPEKKTDEQISHSGRNAEWSLFPTHSGERYSF